MSSSAKDGEIKPRFLLHRVVSMKDGNRLGFEVVKGALCEGKVPRAWWLSIKRQSHGGEAAETVPPRHTRLMSHMKARH